MHDSCTVYDSCNIPTSPWDSNYTWKPTFVGWHSMRINLIPNSKYISFVSCSVFQTLGIFRIVFISLFLCVSLSYAFSFLFFFLLWVNSSFCCCHYFCFLITPHSSLCDVGRAPDKSIGLDQEAKMLCWRLWMLWHSRMDTHPFKEHKKQTHT